MPFLGHLLSELRSRFTGMTGKAVLGLKLLPRNVHSMKESDIAELQTCYGHDLPSSGSLLAEVRLWRRKWEVDDVNSKP